MNKKLFILPFLAVAALSACGGDGSVTVKAGNAVTAAADSIVEVKTAKVLTNALSDEGKDTQYNSPILANADGFYAVSTYGLDASIRTAFGNLKAGDVISFSGKVAASTGGEFGKAGIKQLYPQAAPQVENTKLTLKFAEPSYTVDLGDYSADTGISQNFQTWFNGIQDEAGLFGHRVLFKNVKWVAPAEGKTYSYPGENNTNQAYFCNGTKIALNANEKTVRASIYHMTMPEITDFTKAYDVTAMNFGCNNLIGGTSNVIMRFGGGEAASFVTK